MCGIAGFVSLETAQESLPALERALRALHHRGPDDTGCFVLPAPGGSGPCAALGSRRLSIIDPSPTGHQPMSTADGRYTLVYNGEIYNYRELRGELEAMGRRFRSACDTEVLLQAFDAWGWPALRRLVGMFAFAILDARERRLLLARDFFGIKPLFFARRRDRLIFASEVRALLEFPGISRRVNPARLFDYLVSSNTDHGAETLFADISQVPPGHFLEVSLDRPGDGNLQAHWKPGLEPRCELSFAAAADRLREFLLDSVRLHLRSDVPLGFALSGGLDSSAIVAAARQLQGPSAELHAFSYVADDPRLSEERYADAAGQAAGVVMHKLHLEPADIAQDFDALVRAQGEPFASPTIYAQNRIHRLARDVGLKVVLGGQGSDELFAGYDRYIPARLDGIIQQGDWQEAYRFAVRAGRSKRHAAGLFVRGAWRAFAPGPALRLGRALRRRAALRWLDRRWFNERGVDCERGWPQERETLGQLLQRTVSDAHLQALLRYEDRNAMAYSIENRVPFLTPAIAEFAFSLPSEYLIQSDGTRKGILRAALRGLVPAAILTRRDKIGFAMPVADWLSRLEPWASTKLSQARMLPGLVPQQLEVQWSAVLRRKAVPSAFLVWRCLGLVTWAEAFDVSFG